MEGTDKQKEIEKELYRAGLLSESYNKAVANVLVEAGYRKEEDVSRETAKEIADFVRNRSSMVNGHFALFLYDLADEIEERFGEVDE